MAKIADVQEVSLKMLKPYERNAKIHNDEQVQLIANSIKEFGFLSPCLIDRNYNIIAGHGRVMAAELLGMEKVPCVFVEGLTEDQRRAYILTDNRLTELGGWDYELLDMELEDIDINMTAFGFKEPSEIDIESFFEDAPDKPEKQEEPEKVQCPNCGEWFEV